MPAESDPTVPTPGSGPGGVDPTMLTPPGSGGGGPGGPGGAVNGEGDEHRKIWMIAAAMLAVGLLVGAAVTVLVNSGGGSNTASSTNTTASTTTTSPGGVFIGGGSPGGGGGTPTTKQAGAPLGPAPHVHLTLFSGTVKCPTHQDMPNVTVDYTSTNATKVAVFIDRAEAAVFGPSGSHTVPFDCAQPSHQYCAIAGGSGGQESSPACFTVTAT
jgi:hypothetical protein